MIRGDGRKMTTDTSRTVGWFGPLLIPPTKNKEVKVKVEMKKLPS